MSRGRNKTPAERALEVICSMANVPFHEFQQLLDQSQGDKATKRVFPEASYKMVKHSYFKTSTVSQAQWEEMANHIKAPKTNFGG